MKARAVRLHAANDLRLDEFELPEIKEDEILVKVVSDSICMSTYKCAILGTKHKRVHEDVAEHPAIMGHEFAGDIVKVGSAEHGKLREPRMTAATRHLRQGQLPNYFLRIHGGIVRRKLAVGLGQDIAGRYDDIQRHAPQGAFGD